MVFCKKTNTLQGIFFVTLRHLKRALERKVLTLFFILLNAEAIESSTKVQHEHCSDPESAAKGKAPVLLFPAQL